MPAQSQQQQKLFGLALAVKRGEVSPSEVSDEVRDIVDRMSEKDIEDFAGTSHKGLPKKVEQQIREMVREIMRERVIAEVYDGNMSDFRYEFPQVFNNVTRNSEKAIKRISKKGKRYEVRTSTYMSEPEMKAVGDAMGLKLVDYQKGSSVAVTLYESVNEAASRTAMEIGGLTGMNKDTIQKFVDDNNLDIEKVFQYVKKGKLKDRMDLVSAIAGKPNNPVQKKMIKMFGEAKIKMNNLDWGKSTAERNANLDKYDSLKTDKEKEAFLRKLKGESINEAVNVSGKRTAKVVMNRYIKFFEAFPALGKNALGVPKVHHLGAVKMIYRLAMEDANFGREGNSTVNIIKGRLFPVEVKVADLNNATIKVSISKLQSLIEQHSSTISSAAKWSGIGIVEGTAMYLDSIGETKTAESLINSFNKMFD